MKVIHLACVAPPEIGGIGQSAAKEVSLLRARGIHADLIAPEPPESMYGARDTERSFIKRVRPLLRVWNASILPGLQAHLKSADLIHLHYPFYGVAEPVLLRSGSLPPIVVTYHMDAVADGLKGLAFGAHRKLVQPLLLKHARSVIVSSYDYAKRSGVSGFFEKYPARVKEVPFGVETDVFSPGTGNKRRFMIPDGATSFLFVGGLDRAHAFKGVRDLLEAFARLPIQTQLLIVGDGDLRASYEAIADELSVRARVQFLGRVDQESLIEVYRTADVFVFPSTSRAEAFGLAALEAEACGTPVIASDLPGVRTVVLQGETGLLIRPKQPEELRQAMLRLHEEKTFRERLGRQAREHAETFSWDRHIDALIELYENCRTDQ